MNNLKRETFGIAVILLCTLWPSKVPAADLLDYQLFSVSSFSVGEKYVRDITLANLNGDNALDLVVIAWDIYGSNMKVFMGNGNGSFSYSSTHYPGSSPESIAVGDLNNDGALDIVIANGYYSNNVSVFFGNGDGMFSSQRAIFVGGAPYDVALGDLNNDGTLDIITANYQDYNVSVLLGNGDGTFAPQTTFDTGHAPRTLDLGDLNGDGTLDIVTSHGTISVLMGYGDGSFATGQTCTDVLDTWSIALGDLNEDGALDIATASWILLGQGDGSFVVHSTLEAGGGSLVVADLTGDGHLDIAATSSNNVVVFFGTGDGSFPVATVSSDIYYPPSVLAVGDINNDGAFDLAAGRYYSTDASVLLNRGAPMWHSSHSTTIGPVNAVDAVRFYFPSGMDPNSFSLVDDITSFVGPDGPVIAVGYTWVNLHTLEVTFEPQTALGIYEMVVGPNILDSTGTAMDLDYDLTTGEIPDDQYTATFIVAPSLKWSLNIPVSGYYASSATIAKGGTIYVAGPEVYAINPNDGSLKWSFDAGESIRTSPTIGEDGTIYATGNSGTLYAVNPDGTLEWSFSSEICSLYNSHDVYCYSRFYCPAIGEDGTIYVTESYLVEWSYPYPGGEIDRGSTIHALNPDGNLRWSFDIKDDILSGPAIAADGTIYTAGYSCTMYAINPDGTKKWSSQVASGYIPAIGDRVLALDDDGNIFVQVFISGAGNALQVVNPDGTLKWSYSLPGGRSSSQAVGEDGTVYVAVHRNDGYYSVEAINPDGTLKWSFDTGYFRSATGQPGIGTPAIGADGTIYVAAYKQRIFAINPDGTLKWSLDVPKWIAKDCSPAIGEDGTIYVTGSQYATGSQVYAINGESGGLTLSAWPMFGHDARHTSWTQGLVSHRPSGRTEGPVDLIRLKFRRTMDPTSFSLAEDIASFTGPQGSISPTSYNWVDAHILEITFEPQTAVGVYEMVIGPDILDSTGKSLDLDRDMIMGEVPDDRYIATFIVEAPRLISHIPSGQTDEPVEAIRFSFNRFMDETSFSLADDIVSFTGPMGTLGTTGYSWLDSPTLEVTFEPQTAVGVYEMVIGPSILDPAGIAMDQDDDFLVGEVPDDRYEATFRISPNPHGLFPGEQFPSPEIESMAVGDLNGDGALDLVAVSGRDGLINAVSIHLGKGNGCFAEPKIYNVGYGPAFVSLGDVDNDGALDVVTANWYEDSFSVLLGKGDGTFAPQLTTAFGRYAWWLVLGDINGDNLLDVVTVNDDDTVSVLLGNGDGTFAEPTAYAVGDVAIHILLGDLNNDGALDIVTSNWGEDTVSVLLGNGDGTFGVETTYEVGYGPYFLALGDLNGDGALDIVTANDRDDTVSVLLGYGDGTFAAQETYSVGSCPESVSLGDVDGNGTLDIMTANNCDGDVSVLLGNGDGTFEQQIAYEVGLYPWALSLGDLDGDDALDILVGNEPYIDYYYPRYEPYFCTDTFSVLLGNGDGTFATQMTYTVGDGPESIFVGDLDGDGSLDLVTANYREDTISVLLGHGDGTLAPQTTYAVGDYPYSVSLGDLNGNGHLDIVTVNSYDDTVSVLLGNGDGTFVAQTTHAVGDYPRSVSLGDLNSDGALDIVTVNYYDDTISVLFGQGDGTFADQITYPVGDYPYSVSLGDLNGDGALDLVTTSADDSGRLVSVLLGNGDGTFAARANYDVDGRPGSATLGDVDSDGALDIVTVNWNDNTVSVLVGLGDGTFVAQTNYAVGGNPESVSLGDLNSDGHLDIVTCGWKHISLLLGNGDGTFGKSALYGAGSGGSVSLGDLNSDGALDVVTTDDWLGAVSVLLNRIGVSYSPRGLVAGPVDAIRLHFGEPMDTGSFSLEEDVNSFVGPQGALTVNGYSWLSERTLELTFEPQTEVGQYEMVVGPNILDTAGIAMDLDRDMIKGEVPDDQLRAAFVIVGPRLTSHVPAWGTAGPVDSIRFRFDHDMDDTSFSLTEDIASFTGPEGPITATSYVWVDSRTFDVTFEPQFTVGAYEIVIGPEILDVAGNSMDQDHDMVTGEVPDDQYSANFTIKAPQVTGYDPAEQAVQPLDSIRFSFDHDMNETSFSLSEDIVSFTGPQGSFVATDYNWVDSHTLEIRFEPQDQGNYEIVIGPDILDVAGNAMDQDGDFVPAEVPDDQYVATFILAYSGTMTEDRTWGPERGPILVDGTLTVDRGATLTIESGTIVKFSNNGSIDVGGSLEVVNTSGQPVIFTSSQDDSRGGDTNGDGGASTPIPGDWRGIILGSSGAIATLENVEVRYASTAVSGNASLAKVKLKNCVLRDGRYGIYVYTPYVDIVAENCLIADNALTGVFVRASSSEVLRNCTIVGNGFQGSYQNAGIHLGAATLTVDNCIVAFNKNGLDHSGAPPSLVVRHSAFYNPAGQEVIWDSDPGRPQLDQNGNITTDPLFVDYTAGNYELDAGSEAIDAGRGIHAPYQDILGRDRYDDRGVANIGIGYPSYVDMGAYERQEDTQASDLAVTFVSAPEPEFVSAGDTFTAEWTVTSIGTLDCTGPWQDIVYLSDDPYISPDDLVLETRSYTGTLEPGQSYTETLTLTVPSAAGPKYILAHTNADQAFFEADETNNSRASQRVLAVDVPLLELDSPVTGTLLLDQWNFYRFEGTSGYSVRFSLDATAASGSTGLYTRYSLPPTVSEHDAAGAVYNQPDQEAKLLEPLDGTYYVGLYGPSLPGGSTNYTLTAELTELSIASISPSLVGNVGSTTFNILGDSFLPDDVVYLVAPDGVTQLAGLEVYYVVPSHFFATFDLSGADEGMYDVVVVGAESDMATLTDAVEVTVGGGPNFHASLTMPGIARPGRVITIRVDYSNDGTSDMASPLLTLSALDDDQQWQLPESEEWITGRKLRFMALSTSGPANVLRQNQFESIEVKLRTPVHPGGLQLSLTSLGARPGDGSDKPINWSNRYSDEATVAYMQQVFGDTWAEYTEALGEIAAEVAPWEGIIYSASDLELLAVQGFEGGGNPGGGSDNSTTATEGWSLGVNVWLWNGSNWEIASNANVDQNSRAAIVIHGWNNSCNTDWVEAMARALHNKVLMTEAYDCVLGVDWALYAYSLDPRGPANMIPYVADTAYQLLRGLGINHLGTHIIGHSHGAHVAGLIGNRFGGRIGRITALDPSEESVHCSLRNLGGSAWRGFSGQFVDSYKSSIEAGGETTWGDDNFLLVRGGQTWGWGSPLAHHSYAHEWYLETVRNGGGPLGLGYDWALGRWGQACATMIKNFGGNWNGPWKGLIRGGHSGNHVIECLSEGMNQSIYQQAWLYPGAWPGGYDDSAAIKRMICNLAAAVEMRISDIEALSENGGSVWKAGGKGTVSYTVANNTDNRSLHWKLRSSAQTGRSMGPLTGVVAGPIKDRIWLSEDNTLDPAGGDYLLKTIYHMSMVHFLEPMDEATFDTKINLPGESTILTWWDDEELRPSYYIIVDPGMSETSWLSFSGELYPANNLGITEITIEDEDLSANAGDYPEFFDTDGDGVVTVTLDGSGSAPEELIDLYEWSVGVTGKKVDHQFPIGTHVVALTVTNEASGKTDTDDATIIVRPEDEPPDGDDEDEGDTDIYSSYTPEDKFGPAGYDDPCALEENRVRYIPADQTIHYRIEFWNKEDAPVPTQDAIIEDVLDPAVFDFSTFKFTRFGFLKWDVPLSDTQVIDTRIDCRPEMNIAVEVTATFDPDTGKIKYWFHCVDPLTGDYPEDPMAGFLPPYNPETGFEIGWVEFCVKPWADLLDGTQIANQAFVEFDFLGDLYDHPAPNEGPWINTIDAGLPNSYVIDIPETPPETDFLVEWTGQDLADGSGIAHFDIYVSVDDGKYALWLYATTETSAIFTGEDGHSYAFYSVGHDNVGNVEEAPAQPDAIVAFNLPPVANAGSDQTVEQESYDGTEVTLDGSGSTDPDSPPGTNDDIVSFNWYETETLLGSGETINYTFPLGTHTVTLVVTDSFDETDDDEVIIVVQDTTPPTINSISASPIVLWPPNHEMVDVTVTVDAEDLCDPAPVSRIVNITSNEPIDGLGDGDTTPDWEITGDLTVNVRAERAGVGSGRVYTLHVECTDASGNTATATAEVTVSHDQD